MPRIAAPQPAINLRLEYYCGVSEIAAFLKITERTAKRWLQTGKVPGKKDGSGRWVLTNIDYYLSLQG
jgi:predicted site-specific integrase-resolvase